MNQTSPISLYFWYHTKLQRWHASTLSEHGLCSVSPLSMRILFVLWGCPVKVISLWAMFQCLWHFYTFVLSPHYSEVVHMTSGIGLHSLMSWQSYCLLQEVYLAVPKSSPYFSSTFLKPTTHLIRPSLCFYKFCFEDEYLSATEHHTHIHKRKLSLTHLKQGQKKVTKGIWRPEFNQDKETSPWSQVGMTIC